LKFCKKKKKKEENIESAAANSSTFLGSDHQEIELIFGFGG
jgi:hypothetical protein